MSGLVVSGLGGDASYQARFDADASVIADALRTLSAASQDVQLLLGENATKASVLRAFRELGEKNTEQFVLILIGHGTSDGTSFRFNIPGPDLTTDDLIAGLTEIESKRQAITIATSSSGELLEILAQPSRIVVTATKSPGEINAVRFGEYFAQALDSGEADIDRNEILTVAEVFRYAATRTAEFYESQKFFASEHSRIEGVGAADFPLAYLGALRQAQQNPAVAPLLEERLQLEVAFHGLKARKPDMKRADYYQQLETLLIAIALVQKKIDLATGWDAANG
ncbi:MAG: hypothetical protein ACR2PS_19800 [Pseudomonadales bacterium]